MELSWEKVSARLQPATASHARLLLSKTVPFFCTTLYTYEFVFWMIPIKWFLTVPFPSPAFLAFGSSSARQPSSLLRPSFSSPEVKVIRGFHIFSHNVVNNIWPIDLTAGKICSNPGFSMFGCTQLGHGKLRNHCVYHSPVQAYRPSSCSRPCTSPSSFLTQPVVRHYNALMVWILNYFSIWQRHFWILLMMYLVNHIKLFRT